MPIIGSASEKDVEADGSSSIKEDGSSSIEALGIICCFTLVCCGIASLIGGFLWILETLKYDESPSKTLEQACAITLTIVGGCIVAGFMGVATRE